MVGDQIFTDIIGANLCGMKSVLLEPIQLEKYRQLSAETEVGTAISQKSENGTELKKPGGSEES